MESLILNADMSCIIIDKLNKFGITAQNLKSETKIANTIVPKIIEQFELLVYMIMQTGYSTYK